LKPKPNTSFTVITLFIALSIVGLALTPLLNLRLYPGRSIPSVVVSYQMHGANAVLVDSEVTTRLEGVLSRIGGLQKLKSRTSAGSGSISLEMDKNSDMDAVRFEVSTLVRQVYPSLPETVSYPSIKVNRPDDEDKAETLITFTFSGPGENSEIGQYANEFITPALSEINGVSSVNVYGANARQIELVYNKELLNNIGLPVYEIKRQIWEYYYSTNLGRVHEQTNGGEAKQIPVLLTGREPSGFNPAEITIKHNKRLFKLSELTRMQSGEAKPQSYYRINGLNTVNIVLQAAPGANQIISANRVKETANKLRQSMPRGFNLDISYDSSIQLKNELQKIILRIIASVLILLVFVLLVSRSARYLLIITFSIIANILIAFILYYFLGLEIHMYSLAGITISLGIIIDNTIVMADHLRNGNGLSVFRAILAATLTTIGALVAVFFLDESLKLRLIDFALVIMVNLSVSLIVSLFFIPALVDKLPLRKKHNSRTIKRTRLKVKATSFYGKTIVLATRYRWLVLLLAILSFGLPIYKLPGYSKGDAWYNKLYNNTLGAQFFTEKIKPVSDVALGGTLRLFTEKVQHSAISNSNRRTSLNVSATMNDGSTLEQTNSVFKIIENFLAQYDEIEQFETRIYSPSSAQTTILFKPENEYSSFPYELKSELGRKAIELGSADWSIVGVGRGFNNSLNEGRRNCRIQLFGYNLEQLKEYARKVQSHLVEIPRVEKESIFINGRATSGGTIHREYYLGLNTDKMQRTGISTGIVMNELSNLSKHQYLVMPIYENGYTSYIYLTPETKTIPDFWKLFNTPIATGYEKISRLSQFGSFRKEREQDLINKENMEYTLVVEFNFIGSSGQQKYILGQVEQRVAQQLPIGYRIKRLYNQGGWWLDQDKDNTKIRLILLVAIIIFFICAIVFGSLRQPLAVLLMIPLSFIGVFVTFYLFNLGFDQGGYAALLLLSGLTVNSALYILNDLNNIRNKKPGLSPLRAYLKAYNNKLIPVILTLLSTVLGLVPFLSGGKKEAFWFSLSAGTIGGLIFSLIAIVLILPLFVKGIKEKKKQYK
jgi:multidrug efflux pump subunit AcrB